MTNTVCMLPGSVTLAVWAKLVLVSVLVELRSRTATDSGRATRRVMYPLPLIPKLHHQATTTSYYTERRKFMSLSAVAAVCDRRSALIQRRSNLMSLCITRFRGADNGT